MTVENAIGAAAQLLKTAQRVVAFTGAGTSTPSGIPDFRSPASGLWDSVNPIEVASIYGFRANPQAFFDWVYPLLTLILNAQPNAAHHALAALEAHGKLHAVITQNIDDLHTRAGSQTVHELHGHFREGTCIGCYRVFAAADIIPQFMTDRQAPRCPACGGVVKPNVVLFGEQLPYQAFEAAREAARTCDLMLIIGSSLEVAPASELPNLARRAGAKLIIINLTPTDYDDQAAVVVPADAAVTLPAILAHLPITSTV